MISHIIIQYDSKLNWWDLTDVISWAEIICWFCYDCIIRGAATIPPSLLSGEVTIHQSPGGPRVGFIPGHIIHCPHLQQHRETSSPATLPFDSSPYCPSTLSLGMNFSELLNIQNRDSPLAGPSFTNSWPSPFPQFPQRTLYAPGLSLCLDTLFSWMVSVKAGQGDECSYLERLENNWWSHFEQA